MISKSGANIVRIVKLLGRSMRMDDTRSMKIRTDWKPLGRTTNGQPTKIWMNDLLDDMKRMRMTN